MKNQTSQLRKVAGSPIQLAIFALIAGVSSAQAQEQTQAQIQAQAKAANEAGTIAEVVVTGTKRATSLQRTPVAITALNSAALDDAHVQTLQDIVALVPGFQDRKSVV